jgi:hypothetical protein
MCVYVCTHTHTNTHTHTCVCMYVCIYIYICTHTIPDYVMRDMAYQNNLFFQLYDCMHSYIICRHEYTYVHVPIHMHMCTYAQDKTMVYSSPYAKCHVHSIRQPKSRQQQHNKPRTEGVLGTTIHKSRSKNDGSTERACLQAYKFSLLSHALLEREACSKKEELKAGCRLESRRPSDSILRPNQDLQALLLPTSMNRGVQDDVHSLAPHSKSLATWVSLSRSARYPKQAACIGGLGLTSESCQKTCRFMSMRTCKRAAMGLNDVERETWSEATYYVTDEHGACVVMREHILHEGDAADKEKRTRARKVKRKPLVLLAYEAKSAAGTHETAAGTHETAAAKHETAAATHETAAATTHKTAAATHKTAAVTHETAAAAAAGHDCTRRLSAGDGARMCREYDCDFKSRGHQDGDAELVCRAHETWDMCMPLLDAPLFWGSRQASTDFKLTEAPLSAFSDWEHEVVQCSPQDETFVTADELGCDLTWLDCEQHSCADVQPAAKGFEIFYAHDMHEHSDDLSATSKALQPAPGEGANAVAEKKRRLHKRTQTQTYNNSKLAQTSEPRLVRVRDCQTWSQASRDVQNKIKARIQSHNKKMGETFEALESAAGLIDPGTKTAGVAIKPVSHGSNQSHNRHDDTSDGISRQHWECDVSAREMLGAINVRLATSKEMVAREKLILTMPGCHGYGKSSSARLHDVSLSVRAEELSV